MENKEIIKQRMYKNAVRLWDIKNIDSLDPLIKLLIEALASEIHKLSTDVNSIEIRLLERIAQLLTPDMLTMPQPAHMILSAQPAEDHLTVDKMTAFLFDDPFKNRIPGSLNFHPVNKFSLIKGHVRGLICGGGFYNIDTTFNKEILARSNRRTDIFNSSVWVGLDIDKQMTDIENLSLFFDFPNLSTNKNEYLHLLPFTQWIYKGQAVKTKGGIHIVDKDNKADAISLFLEYDLMNMLDNKVLKNYNQHFVTIKERIPNNPSEYEKLPAELEDYFPPNINDIIERPLLWIKINFPPNFRDTVLSDITASINCFPVLNKGLSSMLSKSKKAANIIPLNTTAKEYFLSVKTIKDEFGKDYQYLPYKNEDRSTFGTYTIKRGGVERFDTRDAKEYISNLIDLLRDETVAFSLLGKDFLTLYVEDMKTKIAVMEQKLSDIHKPKEVSSYLVVDSDDTNESLFIDYWVTNCEFANNIKAGSVFNSNLSLSLNKGSIISLTTSIGGRSVPKSNNKLDIYKHILTSRDRIFTTEDIINFSYSEFGDYFSTIEVKKGVQVGSKPKEGLIRTIDVYATLKYEYDRFSDNKEELKVQLLKHLVEKSPETFNYRIFIQNKH